MMGIIFSLIISVLTVIQINLIVRIFKKDHIDSIQSQTKKDLANETFEVTERVVNLEGRPLNWETVDEFQEISDKAAEVYEKYEEAVAEELLKKRKGYNESAFGYIVLDSHEKEKLLS